MGTMSRRDFFKRAGKLSLGTAVLGASITKLVGEGALLLDNVGYGEEIMDRMTPEERQKFRSEINDVSLKMSGMTALFGVGAALSELSEPSDEPSNISPETLDPQA